MRKYKLAFNHAYLSALVVAIRQHINQCLGDVRADRNWAEMATLVVLDNWINSKRIRNLVRFHFQGERKMALDLEITFALSYVIEHLSIGADTYLGNWLNRIYSELHQKFLLT